MTWLVAAQIGPQCGGHFQAIQMTGISDFVQQSHNFIITVVKLPQGMRRNRAILHLGRTPMNG
jgi:hypothetical protein